MSAFGSIRIPDGEEGLPPVTGRRRKVEEEGSLPALPPLARRPQEALPEVVEVSDEEVDGVSELEDEVGPDERLDELRPKAARERGLDGRTRLPTQKEKDYVDFILKAGGASTHTISRLHQQARGSTFRKLSWLRENDYLGLKEFTYGPPLWVPEGSREVYFSAYRSLYSGTPLSLDKLEHDQIVAYLAAEWVGGMTDNLGLFGSNPPPAILTHVAQNGAVGKGEKQKVSQRDIAKADSVRRNRLASIALTREITQSARAKRDEIKKRFNDNDLLASTNDLVRTYRDLKDSQLAASGQSHFDVSDYTGHSYIHPVAHNGWMAGVPVLETEAYEGRPKIFEPDAVFWDSRTGRIAVEVERSRKMRSLWWEKLWAYYKHNQHVANLNIDGKTGSPYYDRIVYVFTDKSTRDNFRGMLREAKEAPKGQSNRKEKELVEWVGDTKSLLIRDLMIPENNWDSTKLVSYIEQGGVLSL